MPEPTGVVAIVAPQDSSLLGLVSVVAPVLVSGNTVVVLAGEARPLPAITLSEVLATSDVPGGVVNILTGSRGRGRAVARGARGRQRASTWPAPATPTWRASSRSRLPTTSSASGAPAAEDWSADPGLSRLRGYLETKTVWHPIGV